MSSTAPPTVNGTIKLPRDPDLLVREHGRILRLTLADAAIEHHGRHMMRHFEAYAPQKYGYVRRGERYQRLKDRMGLPPLVSPKPKTSGNLRNEIRYHYRVTATQKQSRLFMRLPFQGGTGRLRMRPGQTRLTSPQQQILHRIAELQAVAKDEVNYLAKFIERRYAWRARLPSTGRRVVKF